MKIVKIALLLYNSIFIFALMSIGILTQSYNDLVPIFLTMPVWLYFLLSFTEKVVHFSKPYADQGDFKLKKTIRLLRVYSMIVVSLVILATASYSTNIYEASMILIFTPLVVSFWFDIVDKKAVFKTRIKNSILLTKLARPKTRKKLATVQTTSQNKKSLKKSSINKSKKAKSKSTKNNAECPVGEEYPVGKNDLPEKSYSREITPDDLIIADDIADTDDNEISEEKIDYLGTDNSFPNVEDHKKRQFLKIIGGSSVSLFLMLFVFQEKASASFFGSGGGPGIISVKDSSGNKIDPSEKQPTDGYNISEIDDNTSPSYYGFVHKDGNWYIAKESATGSYRYISGTSNFSVSWAGRALLTYDYFDNIF